MKKRVAYTVVTADSIADLVVEVKHLTGQDWRPQGGFTVSHWVVQDRDSGFSEVKRLYAQALTREE